MSYPAESFLKEWHRVVSERDVAALPALIAENVTMGPPPYWNKFEGRDLVCHLLGIIIEVIEGFTYHREWSEGSELALEFTGHVGDLSVQGIDLITLNEAGQIQNLDVLMRPVNTVLALRERVQPRMMEYLKSRG